MMSFSFDVFYDLLPKVLEFHLGQNLDAVS
jgi:hypothetical protein